MSNKSIISILSIIIFIGLSGCASIAEKDIQELEITTTPESCSITVTDKNGENIYQGKTPFNQTLSKAEGYFTGQIYNIHIEKGGCRPADLVVKSKNNLWYVFGNTANAFIPGWIGVDAKTHAMYELSSSKIHVRLVCSDEDGFPGVVKKEVLEK